MMHLVEAFGLAKQCLDLFDTGGKWGPVKQLTTRGTKQVVGAMQHKRIDEQ